MILQGRKTILIVWMMLQSMFFVPFVYAEDPTPTVTPTQAITTPTPAPTPDNSGQTKDLQDKIAELEGKVTQLKGQTKSLSSQIAVIDNQIKLTQLRMDATRQEIAELNSDITVAASKITDLEGSMDTIMKTLINRVVATYQSGSAQPLQVLLSSGDVTNFLSRLNYLRIVQTHDKKLIYETQQTRNDYENQKVIFEGKKEKVESLRKQLETYTQQSSVEKKTKQTLLEVTRNDEAKYQSLLAQARSEYEAIQGIVAGNGNELLIGPVSEGQRIASVISGASCNSGGTHLHFIVRKGSNTENPFSHLKSVDSENCSGSSCGSGDGDSFNPSGSWNWPIDPTIKLSQGYGSTWATRNTWVGQIYSFHNGIDIVGSSSDVKAVKEGTLYQGSYGGVSGCRLRYVRVDHKDSELDTLYLHINYAF